MKTKTKRRGCSLVILRIFVLPILIGLLVGFAAVVAALNIGERVVAAQSLPTAVPTRPSAGSIRVVILLLDDAEEDIAGVWQWWSDPVAGTGKAACILSTETRIAPSGRTVAEMINLAMAAGDDAWVAKNTRDFAGDCLLGQTSAADEVIFVSQTGMVRLVDALGGIQVEKYQMSGVRAWDYLVSSAASPADVQRRQQDVWVALRSAARRAQRSPCDQITDAHSLFRSVPNHQNSCRKLESLLEQTPSYIATP